MGRSTKEKNIDELSATVSVALPEKTIEFPDGRTVTLNSVALALADDAVADWVDLEIGVGVRFTANLGSRMAIFPPIEVRELSTGTIVVVVRVREGRLIQ